MVPDPFSGASEIVGTGGGGEGAGFLEYGDCANETLLAAGRVCLPEVAALVGAVLVLDGLGASSLFICWSWGCWLALGKPGRCGGRGGDEAAIRLAVCRPQLPA